jgi:hypothetical protein
MTQRGRSAMASTAWTNPAAALRGASVLKDLSSASNATRQPRESLRASAARICQAAWRTIRVSAGRCASINMKHLPNSAFFPNSSKTFCPRGVISTSLVTKAR